MEKYDLTFQVLLNVRVSGVEAATREEAIAAALSEVDLYDVLARQHPTPKVEYTEYAEEIHSVLVDVVGDAEYDKSRWFIWGEGRNRWVLCTPAEELKVLYRKAGTLRDELGCSEPGEVLRCDWTDFDSQMAVVADGLGHASVLVVSGNYPVEYILKEQKDFASEEDACEHAAALLDPAVGSSGEGAGGDLDGQPAGGESPGDDRGYCRTWVCPTCQQRVEHSYEALVEVGVAICSDCDAEMELMEEGGQASE